MHVVFEITKDADLLEQYFALREKTFKRVLGLSQFDGAGEQSDHTNDIFIARIDNIVIGGVRIVGCTPQQSLPLEYGYHHLDQQLPQLHLKECGYCQWMRLTLTRETQIPAKKLHADFFLALAIATNELGYRYGICVSSKLHQRLYKQTFARIGYRHSAYTNIMVENEDEFNDLEHLLCVTDVAQSYKSQLKTA